MGDIKKPRKKYEPPFQAWDKSRLETESKLVKTYALKNKRELYIAQTFLRKKRRTARHLLALPLEERLQRERELLDSLVTIGLVNKTATLDAVLGLTEEALLERRLQTIAWRKGLANTPAQARQFIVHGHVAVNAHRVNAPGYLVSLDEEKSVAYYGKPMQIENPTPKMKKDELKKKFEDIRAGDPVAAAAEEASQEAEPAKSPAETTEVSADE